MSNHKFKIIDIHSHIIPNVDDGSSSLEMSLEMLKTVIKNNVTDIIATPHVGSKAMKTSREMQIKSFNTLKEAVAENNLSINLYLGAEQRYPDRVKTRYYLNDSKYFLIEFSTSEENIEELVYNLTREDHIPIIAHIERYKKLTFDEIIQIKSFGAKIQVNATSYKKRSVRKLLKHQLIDFIASDIHEYNYRKTNLLKAYQRLSKKYDKKYIDDIFYHNALKIIEK